ncbi:hypothetical protein ACGFXB_45415 [Streptomyces canus]|uniref:hypothetical protein n=1 Tax=Streptomyces canus TaxID=58343 RepID=UPI003722C0B3
MSRSEAGGPTETAPCELALMTGMRIQEWSTLLLPELGLVDGLRPAFADVELKACAKFGRPRSVYVAPDPMELLDPYLLLERPEIVAKAQRSLRRRYRELFVIQRLEADGTRVRGVLDGLTITRTIENMKPDLRRLAVRETGDGLDPLACSSVRAAGCSPSRLGTRPAGGPGTG